MADYIVTANAAGTNSGTPANPYTSLAAANAARTFVSGDRILVSGGVVRGQCVWTGDLTGVTIMQDPSSTIPYEQRYSTVVTGFSVVSGNTYSKTIATGLLIRGVSWNYGLATESNGSRYGFLALQASAAAVTASGQYFYDSGTGVLTINVGANPGTGTVEYGVRTANNVGVIQLGNLTDCTIRDLIVSYGLMNSGEGQYGNGISTLALTRTTITNCTVYDTGNHAIVWSGGTHTGARIVGNVMRGGANFSIAHVPYSDTGSSGTDNQINDNLIYAHHYLNIGGTASLDAAPSIGGFYSHTGVGNLDNLVYSRNTVTYLYGATGTPFSAANVTAPSDRTNPATYKVRFIRCALRNGLQASSITGGNSFENCDLDFSQTFATAGGYSWLINTSEDFGFFGCQITSTGVYFTIQVNGSANVGFFASTIINRDATSSFAQNLIGNTIGTPTVTAKGCLFAYSRAAMTNARNLTTLTLTTAGNLCYGHDSTSGDATATTTTTNPFTSIATSGALTAAAQRLKQTVFTPTKTNGINYQLFVGNYGAWQYGAVAIRRRVGGSRRGMGPR